MKKLGSVTLLAVALFTCLIATGCSSKPPADETKPVSPANGPTQPKVSGATNPGGGSNGASGAGAAGAQ